MANLSISRFSIWGLLAASMALLSGCDGDGGDPGSFGGDGPWLGPDATQEDVEAATEELATLVDAAFAETGYQPTEFADLPTIRDATYAGLMLGVGQPDSGPTLDYAADLQLQVEFGSQSVDGTISNVTTTLDGFDHPEGTIDVTGSTYNDSGYAGITFDGSGELTQGDLTADYELPEVFGNFGGDDAQAIAGYQATNFEWTEGQYAGTNSSSDGAFIGVQTSGGGFGSRQ